jgi:hypothetical protein
MGCMKGMGMHSRNVRDTHRKHLRDTAVVDEYINELVEMFESGESEDIVLTREEYDWLMEKLESLPAPSPKLKELLSR